MEQKLTGVPGAAVRGTASGVFFMAVFGTLWAYTGIMGLQGWGLPLLLIAAVAIGAALVFGGVYLIRSSRALPVQSAEADPRFGNRTRFRFNVIFAAEGIAIAIAIAICNAVRHTELIPLIIAIIVGVHFFPLAPLFKVGLYHVTGALLCLLSIVTWVFVPEKVLLEGHEILTYMTVVGLGSALILWATGLSIWLMGKKLLNTAAHSRTETLHPR
ncbi:DUF7010 family protein [Paenibacillus harenae]|uniref:DUF7010 family protein n=1 Tax=Paenibacillus harenae TaxID=306543 RepID=UPI0004258A4B|nr:hypothetical protein [Paenibacillus harenae]